MGFVYLHKIWQILKRFDGTFRRAQTLKLAGVVVESVGLAWSLNLIEDVIENFYFRDSSLKKLHLHYWTDLLAQLPYN